MPGRGPPTRNAVGLPLKVREPSAITDMKLAILFQLISSFARPLAGCLKGMAMSQKINVFKGGGFTMMLWVLFGLKIRFHFVQIRR